MTTETTTTNATEFLSKRGVGMHMTGLSKKQISAFVIPKNGADPRTGALYYTGDGHIMYTDGMLAVWFETPELFTRFADTPMYVRVNDLKTIAKSMTAKDIAKWESLNWIELNPTLLEFMTHALTVTRVKNVYRDVTISHFPIFDFKLLDRARKLLSFYDYKGFESVQLLPTTVAVEDTEPWVLDTLDTDTYALVLPMHRPTGTHDLTTSVEDMNEMSAVKTDEVFAEAKTVATVRISGENMPKPEEETPEDTEPSVNVAEAETVVDDTTAEPTVEPTTPTYRVVEATVPIGSNTCEQLQALDVKPRRFGKRGNRIAYIGVKDYTVVIARKAGYKAGSDIEGKQALNDYLAKFTA